MAVRCLGSVAAPASAAYASPALLVAEETGTVAIGISETPFNASDTVYVTIIGVPADATLTSAADPAGVSYDSVTHSWTVAAGALADLTLSAGEDTTATLSVTATTSGAFGATSAPQTISLTVNPVAQAAILTGTALTASGTQDTAIALAIVATP